MVSIMVKQVPVKRGRLDGRIKYDDHMLDKLTRFFDDWEPTIKLPVEKISKDGEITTEMKIVPSDIPNLGQIAKLLGVGRTTLWKWQDKHPALSNAIKKGVELCFKEGFHTCGLRGDYNTAVSIFLSKNIAGYTDRTENSVKYLEPVVINDEDGNKITELGYREPKQITN